MKFIILGCGSSMGVPRADGNFGKCNPKNKKNFRSRCSALIQKGGDTNTASVQQKTDVYSGSLDTGIDTYHDRAAFNSGVA